MNWGESLLDSLVPLRSIYATSGNENYTLEVKSAMIFHMCMSAVLSVISHIGLFAQDRC